jgi:hypothetical protein
MRSCAHGRSGWMLPLKGLVFQYQNQCEFPGSHS